MYETTKKGYVHVVPQGCLQRSVSQKGGISWQLVELLNEEDKKSLKYARKRKVKTSLTQSVR